MKRRLVFLRALLQDSGGHSDAYASLIWAVAVISIAVGVRFRDEIRAALADAIRAISGLLGVWR
jgi:hypothetical protein